MNVPRRLLTSVLAALLLLSMAPMPAPIYMNVPSGEVFATKVQFEQAALCDGSVRLEKGSYDVSVKSLGDGSVRATISGNGKTCQVTGKIKGHEGVVAPGGLQPGADVSVQKVQPAGAAPSFTSLGFTPRSEFSFQKHGNQLNVILKGQGSNQILIGLLLPAVQKVREAANKPH
jgi:hypothetical protein